MFLKKSMETQKMFLEKLRESFVLPLDAWVGERGCTYDKTPNTAPARTAKR